ncbi:Pyridoxamine 5'-phosphate oxidase [Arachidicoccus rhizosphaerae]|uniref:Pyridoxine/pyridoxamine 5'-phosphate oxidase n=1 Tax=Arachidicoccus rhizosphaerae TaxID=551991 RepID=A0A1H3WY16_9BACT|nr:pyridoxamine 5'-phosphate oxidase [Arachidicoccus rhizosphaerae]SDZ91118.1 Pyridoxamine 5'-phosphate oxidase [Arachidicoccus rhizosphaerae]
MAQSTDHSSALHSHIADIRTEYKQLTLSKSDVEQDPFNQFDKWWKQAINAEAGEVNAMTLATATQDGLVDARIVLLKNIAENGFVFFTNYDSSKGRQLEQNPNAALVFFWKELERQVRVKGKVHKVSTALSDQYFASRPHGSQIGAWSSPQSQPIASRSVLQDNEKKYGEKFPDQIPRPEHWGGYVLIPDSIEFWQGRPSRLHDRILYTLTQNSWQISRLAP